MAAETAMMKENETNDKMTQSRESRQKSRAVKVIGVMK